MSETQEQYKQRLEDAKTARDEVYSKLKDIFNVEAKSIRIPGLTSIGLGGTKDEFVIQVDFTGTPSSERINKLPQEQNGLKVSYRYNVPLPVAY